MAFLWRSRSWRARAALVGIGALDLAPDNVDLLAVSGRRTASSRHRTMRATLDWSYQYLSPVERDVLQRLSVFRGRFTAASAMSVAKMQDFSSGQVLEALMSLAAKSLLSTETSGPEFNYRLLHVTRVYAAELLVKHGNARDVQLRHAEHWCESLEALIHDHASPSRASMADATPGFFDDVRAALEWSFGPQGSERLGARLTVAAVTFGIHLSLVDEFKNRTSLALAAVRRFATPDPDLEVRLGIALNVLHTRTADSAEVVRATMERAVALAKESGSSQNTIWALTTRALTPLDFGDYANGVDVLTELDAAARNEDNVYASLSADRVGAMVLHWAGSHARARVLAERVLRHPAGAISARVQRLVSRPPSLDAYRAVQNPVARRFGRSGARPRGRGGRSRHCGSSKRNVRRVGSCSGPDCVLARRSRRSPYLYRSAA